MTDLRRNPSGILDDAGYRLVYEVIERRLVVVVVAVGRRDHNEVYWVASKRHAS